MCRACLLAHFKWKWLVVLLYKSRQIIALFITNKMMSNMSGVVKGTSGENWT